MPGFTSGFTGGVALTLGVAYLTVLSHERNRHTQAHYLRSQTQLLTSLLDSEPVPPHPSHVDVVRQSRNTFTELAKDRWNREIENVIRWVQTTDWSEVREGIEGAVARLLRRENPWQGIEESKQKAWPRTQDAVSAPKAEVQNEAAAGIEPAKRASEAIIIGINQVSTPRKDMLGKGSADEGAGAEKRVEGVKLISKLADQEPGASNTDDTAGVVQNAISRGIEKGKGLIDRAQAAIELSEERLESRTQAALARMSETERALHERYEKADTPDKTVEEVLEERYKAIDQRDRTVLRGL